MHIKAPDERPGNRPGRRWLPAQPEVPDSHCGESCGHSTVPGIPPNYGSAASGHNHDQKGHHQKPQNPQQAPSSLQGSSHTPRKPSSRPSTPRGRPSTPRGRRPSTPQQDVQGQAQQTSTVSEHRIPEGYMSIPMSKIARSSVAGSDVSERRSQRSQNERGSEGSKRRSQSARSHRESRSSAPGSTPAGRHLHLAQDLATDADLRGQGRRCICQICNCGQHKCNCRPAEKRSAFEGVTSYMKDYVKYPVTPRREAIRPVAEREAPARFEGQTQYQLDYTKKSLPRQEPFHENLNLEVSRHVPFCGDTTYGTHYKAPTVHVRPKKRPEAAPWKYDGGDDRDWNTAYKADYYQKALPKGCPILDLPSYPRDNSPGRNHAFWDSDQRKWV